MSYIHSFTHSTNSYRASTKFQVLVKYQWHLSEQDRQKSLCSWSLHPSGFRNVRMEEGRGRVGKKKERNLPLGPGSPLNPGGPGYPRSPFSPKGPVPITWITEHEMDHHVAWEGLVLYNTVVWVKKLTHSLLFQEMWKWSSGKRRRNRERGWRGSQNHVQGMLYNHALLGKNFTRQLCFLLW